MADLGPGPPGRVRARPLGDPPRLREHIRTLVVNEAARPTAVLTPGDLDALERIGIVMGAALLLDLEPSRV